MVEYIGVVVVRAYVSRDERARVTPVSSWAIVTTYESTNASPILVLSCELDVLGIVVITACFGGMLLALFYHNLGSKYIIKPYGKYHGRLVNGLGI